MGESASHQELLQDHEGNIANSLMKENEHDLLANAITKTLESLKPLLESPGICIYKVPDPLRYSNEEAYTPQVISIGPFHRENKKLQAMEKFKLRYLKSFMKERATAINLEDLVSTIKAAEESVRECYSETFQSICSDDFVEMILLDSIFIIEFFLRNLPRKDWMPSDQLATLKPWLRSGMELDFMLLENQLPFFIIQKIYEITVLASFPTSYPSFIDLTFQLFSRYNLQNKSPCAELNILHFADLVRFFCLPPPERQQERGKKLLKEMHSATQLAEVGLKFKWVDISSKCSQLDLKFTNDGVLHIPRFDWNNTSELYARNLIAIEQCHYPDHAYVTDYYILLRYLIKTGKDVDLLVREEIITDWLDDTNSTTFVSKLCGNIVYSSMNANYHSIGEDLSKFYKTRVSYFQILWATLKRDYFRTPWMGASTIAAVILLVLTVIQTGCSLSSL
ncbi:hypothetical protein F2P56_013113 [Juglans regia]|uniref:Uncharacterized protein n=2 Tax=Juglans regia TaxID=51240 RepID=A0A834CYS7_JUGRE|nr:UPF0481 protein At3g47200-like [Juglans regia]KAF5469008.1 hypothetical protein F2P56_013113 [Juglans regia]